MTVLKPNEVLNDLLGYEGLKIIQRPDMFNFSLDSTLLADFVKPTKKVKKIMDFGTGLAPVPLFLSLKTDAKIIGIEIQKEVFDIAVRNIEINSLTDQITILNEDIKRLHNIYNHSSIDLITCNPPFFKFHENANINNSDYKTIARHEKSIDLESIITTAKYLLNNKAHLYMVHRPERLSEILELLKKHRFSVKRLRFIHPKEHQNANMVLIDASKQGLDGMLILPPLYVHNEHGYTEEIKRIFNYGRK